MSYPQCLDCLAALLPRTALAARARGPEFRGVWAPRTGSTLPLSARGPVGEFTWPPGTDNRLRRPGPAPARPSRTFTVAGLQSAGKTGNRAVVECGRLLDPYHVLRAGMVPYWCESATIASVDAAERWLVGSRPFSVVEVLPEQPPDTMAVHCHGAAVGRTRACLPNVRRRVW